MRNGKRWSSWWRDCLGLSADGAERTLEILTRHYIEEKRHVSRLTQHAGRMQYPQFHDKLLSIATDEERHAEWLAEKIRHFGGRLPDVIPSEEPLKNSWQHLMDDLKEHRLCDAELLAEAQSLRGEFPTIAEILERIHQDGIKHRDEIRNMLMKSDPQALSGWMA